MVGERLKDEIKDKIWKIVEDIGYILDMDEDVSSYKVTIEIDDDLEIDYIVWLKEEYSYYGDIQYESRFSVVNIRFFRCYLYEDGKWKDDAITEICKSKECVEYFRNLEPKITRITIVKDFDW